MLSLKINAVFDVLCWNEFIGMTVQVELGKRQCWDVFTQLNRVLKTIVSRKVQFDVQFGEWRQNRMIIFTL